MRTRVLARTTHFGMTAVRAALAFLPPAIRRSCTNGRRKGSTIARREKRSRQCGLVGRFERSSPRSQAALMGGELAKIVPLARPARPRARPDVDPEACRRHGDGTGWPFAHALRVPGQHRSLALAPALAAVSS